MKIKEYREKYHLTYQVLAAMFRVDITTIRNWVVVGMRPRLEKAHKIVRKTQGEISYEDLGYQPHEVTQTEI